MRLAYHLAEVWELDAHDIRSAFTQLGRRELVAMMHQQLDELLAARDQMELLLRVVVQIGSDLDPDASCIG